MLLLCINKEENMIFKMGLNEARTQVGWITNIFGFVGRMSLSHLHCNVKAAADCK